MTAFLDDVARGAVAPDRPALRRVVALDPDAFARDVWSRRPLLSRSADLPRGFEDLFSLEAVDELLSVRGLRTPFLRLAKDGTVVAPSRFTGGAGVGAGIGDQVRDDRVAELFTDGSTVVLQALHRTWAPVGAFAAALTSDLGHPVQVNAYVTPPQSQGFSSHYDVHDVVVLQVAGEKRWRIHAPVLQHPQRDQPWTDRRPAVAARAAEDPVLDEVLSPGDALYLPRGWLHAATALGDVSCHLTFGIHVHDRAALVQEIARLVLEDDDPELRETLPLGVDVTDPVSLAPHVAAVAAVLAGRVRGVQAASVAQRLTPGVLAASRPGPVRPLAQAAAARSLAPASAVRLRPHLRAAVRTGDDGEVSLRLADRSVDLPAGVADAVRVLLDGAPRAVTDVASAGGLEVDDALVLVRRLLREAVVVPA